MANGGVFERGLGYGRELLCIVAVPLFPFDPNAKIAFLRTMQLLIVALWMLLAGVFVSVHSQASLSLDLMASTYAILSVALSCVGMIAFIAISSVRRST